jgi:hypothetical protein
MNLQKMIGATIEIPVHYDMWMRGGRIGVITSYRNGKVGQSDYVCVAIPGVRRRVKIWRHDWEYCTQCHVEPNP